MNRDEDNERADTMSNVLLVLDELKKLDAASIANILNGIVRGVTFNGCTKRDMLQDVSEGFYDLHKTITKLHVNAVRLIVEKNEMRKREISAITAQYRSEAQYIIAVMRDGEQDNG